MTLRHIDRLFQDNRYTLHKCLFKSTEWMLDEIEEMEKEYGEQVWNPGSIMTSRQWNGTTGLTKILVPGNFYMCVYEPVFKQILPYYDIFPLTLVFEADDEWFRGLNFHYVPYRTRIQLLGHLMNYATTISPQTGKPVLNDQTRLLFDWNTIDNSAVRPLVRPIARRYRIERARTEFKYINPLHWALMLLLPCEQFVKESNRNKVWDDTAKQAMEISKEYEEQKEAMRDDVEMLRDKFDSLDRQNSQQLFDKSPCSAVTIESCCQSRFA